MPEVKKPRTGTMQFWPRKRASRIYPRLSTYPSVDSESVEKPKLLAFAGYKAGMTQIVAKDQIKGSPTFGEDILMPVTVLDCPPLYAVGIRAYSMKTGGMSAISEFWADKLPKALESTRRLSKAKKGKGEEKHKGKELNSGRFAKIEKEAASIVSLRMILATQPVLSGIGKKNPEIFEFEIVGKTVADKLKFAREILGKEIKSTDVFREGEIVDAIAITKGKGMAGPTQRMGSIIQNRHATHKRRHVGSLGQEQPGKVRHTVPMAGQLGFQQRTEHNKRVMKIADADGVGKDVTPDSGFVRYGVVKGPYMLIEGSVPGPRKRLIFLRSAMRQGRNKFIIPEIKEILR
jgi:large subunit ribosomal protein L3